MIKRLIFIKLEQARQERAARRIREDGERDFRTRLRESKAAWEYGRVLSDEASISVIRTPYREGDLLSLLQANPGESR